MAANSGGEHYLTTQERQIAASIGAVLIVLALALVLLPPDRTQAIDGCNPTGDTECTVDVDGDINVFAGVLVALGGDALLVGLLGIRFSSIEAGGVKLGGQSFDEATKGLAPAQPASAVVAPGPPIGAAAAPLPTELATAGAVAELAQPMAATDATALDTYRRRVYDSHRDVFLTHLLAPPTQHGQAYRVAVFLTGHD